MTAAPLRDSVTCPTAVQTRTAIESICSLSESMHTQAGVSVQIGSSFKIQAGGFIGWPFRKLSFAKTLSACEINNMDHCLALHKNRESPESPHL